MGNGKCWQWVGGSWLILKIEMGHLGGWGTWVMGHMANGTHGQRSLMVIIKDRDWAPWGMGHMGDGAHGQWGTWPMEHMGITWDTWAMANMVKGVSWLILQIEMGHLEGWGTWAMGHMGITSLILEESSPKFNST